MKIMRCSDLLSFFETCVKKGAELGLPGRDASFGWLSKRGASSSALCLSEVLCQRPWKR